MIRTATRKTELLGLLVALRSYSGKIAGQDGYYLDHSRWHAEHGESGHPDSTVWFHGTRHSFNSLRHPRQTGSATQHVDSLLGIHFAHKPDVTDVFTDQGYDSLSAKKENQSPRIIPARLTIHNPRHFDSEQDLNALALSTALYHGVVHPSEVHEWLNDLPDPDTIEGHLPDERDIERATWDNPEKTAQRFRDVANEVLKYGVRYGDTTTDEGLGGRFHLYNSGTGGWDNAGKNHPRLMRIARNLRKHLESKGHDGVTYQNEVEGGIGAIAFSPNQVHEAYGHGDKTRRFADLLDLKPWHEDRHSYADQPAAAHNPALHLVTSKANPHVKRWQAWHEEAGPIPDHLKPHADNLKQQVAKHLSQFGDTPESALAHANTIKSAMASPESIAEAAIRLKTFAPALIDHLYSGELAHSNPDALKRLGDLQIKMEPGGFPAYEGSHAGGTGGIKLHMPIDAVGHTAENDALYLEPETLFAHEMAHALDNQQALSGLPAKPSLTQAVQASLLAQQGKKTHADAMVTPTQFADLHNALHSFAVPDPETGLHVLPPFPIEASPLEYPMGTPQYNTIVSDHQAARLGAEWITGLTEMAMKNPEMLHGLNVFTPEGSTPMGERVSKFWGFDFPGQNDPEPEHAQQMGMALYHHLTDPENFDPNRTVYVHGSHKMRDYYSK